MPKRIKNIVLDHADGTIAMCSVTIEETFPDDLLRDAKISKWLVYFLREEDRGVYHFEAPNGRKYIEDFEGGFKAFDFQYAVDVVCIFEDINPPVKDGLADIHELADFRAGDIKTLERTKNTLMFQPYPASPKWDHTQIRIRLVPYYRNNTYGQDIIHLPRLLED